MRGHGEPCAYCKREMRGDVAPSHPLRATKDHYMPKSRRKGDDETIIVMACYTCNHIKADRFPEQWDRFMLKNPRWWEPRGERQKQPAQIPAPIPLEHSKYILTHGKKAYRAWVAAGCPEKPLMRPLRPDEPLPIEYDDPIKQAAFEAAYTKWGRWLLRVPQSDGAGQGGIDLCTAFSNASRMRPGSSVVNLLSGGLPDGKSGPRLGSWFQPA